ncbi:MAG: Crp/Fnr family transcriptional regulator [Prevotella sp.]|nr:Crp/Fnr family transcriptional regulator [Prevotella sp.]
MSNFNTYIDSINTDFWRDLCVRYGKARHFKRGEFFVRRGERVRYFGYVESGYFKYSVFDTDYNECITGFAQNRTIVGEYQAMIKQTPAETDIVAAKASDVYLCHVSVFRKIMTEEPMLRVTLAEALFSQAWSQYLDMFRFSPKERYMRLLKRCPDITNTVTIRELASFLNVTPTHLCRIRKEIIYEK